jgi:hypothetical protein
MKRQLQGIALILFAILMMIGYGDQYFFDLDFNWSMIFKIIAIAGLVMTFLPEKKK